MTLPRGFLRRHLLPFLGFMAASFAPWFLAAEMIWRY